MRALLLLAHTNPSLVNNIIVNKLGGNNIQVDPKKDSKTPIIMFTDISKAKSAYIAKKYEKAIGIAVCSSLDAQQIKGAIPLDFVGDSLDFHAGQICKFNTLFDLFYAKDQIVKFRFKSKSLLTKIINLKMSTNIISLCQTMLYDIAIKSKRKQLRRILITWLSFDSHNRPLIHDFLIKQEYKFKELPNSLKKKILKWQEFDKLKPTLYNKFLNEAKGKPNKEIAILAVKYGISSFDGITLVSWLKGL